MIDDVVRQIREKEDETKRELEAVRLRIDEEKKGMEDELERERHRRQKVIDAEASKLEKKQLEEGESGVRRQEKESSEETDRLKELARKKEKEVIAWLLQG